MEDTLGFYPISFFYSYSAKLFMESDSHTFYSSIFRMRLFSDYTLFEV